MNLTPEWSLAVAAASAQRVSDPLAGSCFAR
jgi:hypothetical protein